MKGVNQKFFLMFFLMLNLLLFAHRVSAQGVGQIAANGIECLIIVDNAQYTNKYRYQKVNLLVSNSEATLTIPRQTPINFAYTKMIGNDVPHYQNNSSGSGWLYKNGEKELEVWIDNSKVTYIAYKNYERGVLQDHIQAYVR